MDMTYAWWLRLARGTEVPRIWPLGFIFCELGFYLLFFGGKNRRLRYKSLCQSMIREPTVHKWGVLKT